MRFFPDLWSSDIGEFNSNYANAKVFFPPLNLFFYRKTNTCLFEQAEKHISIGTLNPSFAEGLSKVKIHLFFRVANRKKYLLKMKIKYSSCRKKIFACLK